MPGRELELVAGHARAGDLADDRGIDTEVGQRLQVRVSATLRVVALAGRLRRRRLQQRAVGQDVVPLRGAGGSNSFCCSLVSSARPSSSGTAARAPPRRRRGSRGRRPRAARAAARQRLVFLDHRASRGARPAAPGGGRGRGGRRRASGAGSRRPRRRLRSRSPATSAVTPTMSEPVVPMRFATSVQQAADAPPESSQRMISTPSDRRARAPAERVHLDERAPTSISEPTTISAIGTT